jgi:hypothetical protein
MHTHLVVLQSCHNSGCTLLYFICSIDHACRADPQQPLEFHIHHSDAASYFLSPVSVPKLFS